MYGGGLDPEVSDAELLQRAKAGERDAFGAIYGRYQHIVYRFARAMTGSADVAADVAQEVFVTFMRDLGRYDAARGALPTYLYGIARNISRHRLRRERRFLSMESIDAASSNGRPDDPANGLATAQTIARLRVALGMLPTRYREVIVLSELHELPGPVVAEIVGISASAVRSRLHRGRRMLKVRIQRLETAAMRPAAHPTMRCSV
jgi:RNA polymerase sigma-70 factor (ECF subfamily)